MPPKKRTRSTSPVKQTEEEPGKSSPKKVAPKKGGDTGTLQREGTVTAESILAATVPYQRITKDTDFNPKTMYKIISYNVAGLRAVDRDHKDSFLGMVTQHDPDVLCLQETKLQEDDADYLASIPGYTVYDSFSTEKKGYSGTRVYVKAGLTHEVSYGLGAGLKPDQEGRVIIVTLPHVTIVNTYVPNAGMKLERLDERIKKWDPKMEQCLMNLQKKSDRAVIWTGDLNVAERDYDTYFRGTFKAMQKNPGFTPEERNSFRGMLSRLQMVDSFRLLYPNARDIYTYWSQRFGNLKKTNQGWRLDYFVVSKSIASKIIDQFMLKEQDGSDHCPLVLWMRK